MNSGLSVNGLQAPGAQALSRRAFLIFKPAILKKVHFKYMYTQFEVTTIINC